VEQRVKYRERGRLRKGRVHRGQIHRPEHRLKSFICQLCLVDSLGGCIPSLWIGVCGSSKGHSSNLALDV